MAQTDWWKTFFDEKYLETYLHEFPAEQTGKQVDFVIKAAQLTKMDTILDLACGYGRHSIELAKRGYNVTGVDYSQLLLDKALKDSQDQGLHISFKKVDMKELTYIQEFNVVLMLFTAFGYFSHDSNIQALQRVSNALKPQGRFLLDVLNSEAVVKRFEREGIKKENESYQIKWSHEMSGTIVDEVQELNTNILLEHTHREWEVNGKKRSDDFYLQHYTLKQYKDMFEKVGLKYTRVWGDYDGNPQNEKNWRALILSEKK